MIVRDNVINALKQAKKPLIIFIRANSITHYVQEGYHDNTEI
jgi:hypothetical protein